MKAILVSIYNKLFDYRLYLLDWYRRTFKKRPKIMTRDDTIDYIIKNKASVSRYGDGELKIIDGDRISFQNYDSELAGRLKEVLSSNDEGCLVCMTNIFGSLGHLTKKAQRYYKSILPKRRMQWYSYMDLERLYGDANITRFFSGGQDYELAKHIINRLKMIWDSRNLLIVEGEKSRMGVGNDLYSNASSIRRILCPATDAFDFYDEILSNVREYAQKDDLIIIALGPTATVLAYDLSRLGFQALDLGHMDIEYEWYIRKDTEKKKIDNKYVGEAEGGAEVDDCSDPEYINQIISNLVKGE